MKLRLNDTVYEHLKNELLNNSFPVDGLLSEQYVADHYGVSRSPARAALLRLCAEGYLIKYPQKGYAVKDLRGRILREKRQLRASLEIGIAVYLIYSATQEEIDSLYQFCNEDNFESATTNNRAFHLGMAGLLRNEEIISELTRLIDESSPKILDSAQENLAKKQYITSHRRIVDSIKSRDLSEVVQCINADINTSIT